MKHARRFVGRVKQVINLREYRDSDVKRLQSLANNENVAKYMTSVFPSPYTHDDAQWWLSTGCKSGIVRAIEYDGEFVGSVGGNVKTDERSRTAAVGYWIGEPYWGKGIASAALKLFSQQLFASTNLLRLEASICGPNSASMRTAEKAGFEKEAVLRNALFMNDTVYDEHIYSMLSENANESS